MNIVKITKPAKPAPRTSAKPASVKVSKQAASFATKCGENADAMRKAARAEASGREELRRLMAGVVVIAAKGNMSRADAGKILAEALGLPNMARTVKGADGKHVAAESWIVSLVNAWQYAASYLASRQPAKPATDKGESEDEGETGEPNTREGKVETAADFVALYVAFRKHGKSPALEALEMIAAREGFILAKALAKAA